jgi:hypothetical protein
MANEDPRLGRLWDLLVDDMVDRLENGEDKVVSGDEGKTVEKVKASAATLSVIAKFVKDHQISNPLSSKPDRLAQLIKEAGDELPDEDYPNA